jgi:hypothetical protein
MSITSLQLDIISGSEGSDPQVNPDFGIVGIDSDGSQDDLLHHLSEGELEDTRKRPAYLGMGVLVFIIMIWVVIVKQSTPQTSVAYTPCFLDMFAAPVCGNKTLSIDPQCFSANICIEVEGPGFRNVTITYPERNVGVVNFAHDNRQRVLPSNLLRNSFGLVETICWKDSTPPGVWAIIGEGCVNNINTPSISHFRSTDMLTLCGKEVLISENKTFFFEVHVGGFYNIDLTGFVDSITYDLNGKTIRTYVAVPQNYSTCQIPKHSLAQEVYLPAGPHYIQTVSQHSIVYTGLDIYLLQKEFQLPDFLPVLDGTEEFKNAPPYVQRLEKTTTPQWVLPSIYNVPNSSAYIPKLSQWSKSYNIHQNTSVNPLHTFLPSTEYVIVPESSLHFELPNHSYVKNIVETLQVWGITPILELEHEPEFECILCKSFPVILVPHDYLLADVWKKTTINTEIEIWALIQYTNVHSELYIYNTILRITELNISVIVIL